MTLKDVTVSPDHLDRVLQDLLDCHPTRLSTGIYVDCGFNFHNAVDRNRWGEIWGDFDGPVPQYGVADSVEQFLALYGEALEQDPRGCAVGFTEVRRDEQPAQSGWRWHKWGPYVGKHDPQCEYLYNEKGIDSVVTFSLLWEKT